MTARPSAVRFVGSVCVLQGSTAVCSHLNVLGPMAEGGLSCGKGWSILHPLCAHLDKLLYQGLL